MESSHLWCVLVSVVLFLCLQPLATAQSSDPSCYCTAGSDCVNNTCNRESVHFQCMVRRIGNAYHLDYLCLAPFIACTVSEGYYVCCNGPDSADCNKCPDLSELGIFYADELERLNVPPECGYTLPPRTTANTTTVHVTPKTTPSTKPLWLVPVIVLAIILLLVVMLAIFVCFYIFKRRCKSVDVESIGSPSFEGSTYAYGMSLSCGSGAFHGNRMLQTKTLSKMMTLQECIAKGGFGEVWKAEWDGLDYAVKIFRSTLYEHWGREGEIYKTAILTHPNILHFVSMDSDDNTYGVDFWLIFDYHHNGSLSSYLRVHTLSQTRALTFLSSIAAGLVYLHRHIPTSTTEQKPIIAHRDLKSSNVLIKDDMTCCIGDLGLAVTEADFKMGEKVPNSQQGTKRYMAPEVLAGTINKRSIHSYVMADIYALSLLMWEVAKRCETHGEETPYEVPYQNMVPSDPTIEDMRKKVVEEGIRPPLDPAWKNDEVLCEVSRMLQECWSEVPAARLTAMRIKQNLQNIDVDSKPGVTTNE